jgi:ABC-type multidrug transport system ATPase subunit
MNIRAKNLTAGYTKGIPAVSIDELSIPESSKINLIKGQNGAGKTTFLKALIKALPYHSGEITYGDLKFCERNRNEIMNKLGFCFTTGLSYPNMTLMENISLFQLLYKNKSQAFSEEIIELLQIESIIDVKAGKLSLGRRKFIDFALCLMHEPEVVFLDEPTANLDATSMEIMLDAIQYLTEQKQMSFLIATNESDHFKSFLSNEILINQVNANYYNFY